MPPRAVIQTLDHVWAILEPLGAPMALIGGLALAAWKHVRATQDVDLLLGVAPSAIDQVLQILAAAELRFKRSPPVLTLGQVSVVQLEYEPPDAFVEVQIDVLLVDSPYHRQALDRCITLRLPELEHAIRVLRCEDLVLHKLLAGRIIDRADAAALLRANRPVIEASYLRDWSCQLGLEHDLQGVWDEAFPDEHPTSD